MQELAGLVFTVITHPPNFTVVYNKENLERQETNKYGSGTERHLPETDESVVRPAGDRRKDI